MKKNHVVKSDLAPFANVWSGVKRAEVRVNDRDYAVGDTLTMTEFNGLANLGNNARFIRAEITHVQTGYGLPDNLAVLSFNVLSRHHSDGEPVKEKPLATIKDIPAMLLSQNQAVMPAPDGRFVVVNFDSQTVEQGWDFGVLREQANAWTEVANCIHEIDPDWHQNGRPVDSAVKFIKKLADYRPKSEWSFAPSEYFTLEQSRVCAAITEMMVSKQAVRNEWYYFDVRIQLNGSTGSSNYSMSEMTLVRQKDLDFYARVKRGPVFSPMFGAPYGQNVLTVTKTDRGHTVEQGLPATSFEALPTGATIAASLGINARPVYSKAPGEHPADRQGEEL